MKSLTCAFILSVIFIVSLGVSARGNEMAEILPDVDRAFEALAQLRPEPMPEVESLAREMGSAEAVFAFVRDEIAYQEYRGYLRGPLGTLLSGNGNDIDQSGLLAALLDYIGIEYRFAMGKRQDSADQWVDHLWVQMKEGNTWTDLDPVVTKQASESQRRFQRATDLIPRALFHKIHLEVKIRTRTGGTNKVHTALVQEFDVATLCGQTLTLANRFAEDPVQSDYQPQVVQPVLKLGQALIPGEVIPEVSDQKRPVPASRLSGTFQQREEHGASEATEEFEVLSEWIEIQIFSPGSGRDRFDYTIFDREKRQDAALSGLEGLLATVAMAFSPVPITEAIQQHQLKLDVDDVGRLMDAMTRLSSGEFSPQDPDRSLSSKEQEEIALALEDGRRTLAWTVLQSYLRHSDEALLGISAPTEVTAYREKPRAIFASVGPRGDRMRCDVDLRRNPARYMLPQDASVEWTRFLNYHRGLFDSRLEGAVLKSFFGQAGFTAGDVLTAAGQQNIPLRIFHKQNRSELRSFALDDEVKTLVTAAISRGKTVIVPEQPAIVDGSTQMAWFEYDPKTGYIDGVFPSGKHQAMTEYFVEEAISKTLVAQGLSYFSSLVAGYYFSIATGLGHFYACLLDLENPNKPCLGTADVCGPAKSDAVMFCTAWKNAQAGFDMAMAGASADIVGVIPWPSAWEYLAGEPCEHGASFGLKIFGCGN